MRDSHLGNSAEPVLRSTSVALSFLYVVLARRMSVRLRCLWLKHFRDSDSKRNTRII